MLHPEDGARSTAEEDLIDALLEGGEGDADSYHDAATLDVSEDLVASPTHKAAGTGAIDFDGLLNPALRLHEDVRNGNGGQAWIAGIVLATYLLRHKRAELSKTGSVLELGAGGGLVGLAIALGCQERAVPIHITDQPCMVPLMERNIALNGLNEVVVTKPYSWGKQRPADVPLPEIVLAADCVYFEPAFPLLLRTLVELLEPSGVDATSVAEGKRVASPKCYFCFKRRRRADMHFMKAARKVLEVEEVQDDTGRDAYARENIVLCTIRAKTRR